MQIFTKGKKGDSLENAIIIEATNGIAGVAMEHGYIDQLIDSLDIGVASIVLAAAYKCMKMGGIEM